MLTKFNMCRNERSKNHKRQCIMLNDDISDNTLFPKNMSVCLRPHSQTVRFTCPQVPGHPVAMHTLL